MINLLKKINGILNKDYKSVYFLGNNYHSFYSLSKGLKKLGWKTFCFNPDIGCPYIHNYDAQGDLSKFGPALQVFFNILLHYKFLHIYSDTRDNIYKGSKNLYFLKKILTISFLKKVGVKILYTPSGCYQGSTSKEINILSPGVCDKCIWQNTSVCDDKKNKDIINWIKKNVDVYVGEIDLPRKISFSSIGYRLPLSALDLEHYNIFNLKIPNDFIIDNPDNKIIIFTAFGNEYIRTSETKDIKGKKIIIKAINKLIEEGYPILHFHATEVLSKYMRYYQIQADLVVDQLNYGTIGSSAREALMLGKPTICHVSKLVRETNIAMKSCPAIDANEENVYDVIKKYISNKDLLKIVGLASREWAIKWYSHDSCAQRYERLIQNILEKKPLMS